MQGISLWAVGLVCMQYTSFVGGGADVGGHGCSVVICVHIGVMLCVVLCVEWSMLVRIDKTMFNGVLTFI